MHQRDDTGRDHRDHRNQSIAAVEQQHERGDPHRSDECGRMFDVHDPMFDRSLAVRNAHESGVVRLS